jgi:SAM-dependent MidA family methyltransferase
MTASAARPLPRLSMQEAQHSQAVRALIQQRIHAHGGWLDFETFMDLALYAPGLGYYSAGTAKLGSGGDFVTAPELSHLFSACVARQCAEILTVSSGSEILEFGAGTARMAAGVLEHLASWDALPERYFILEVSADLKARQQERIARLPSALAGRVCWLDSWPASPIGGAMLANEVLDALPCARFALRESGVHAVGVVTAPDGAFMELERPADAALQREVAAIVDGLPEPLAPVYRSECCPRAGAWIAGAAQCLARGALLIFDYGLPRAHYYHPQRDAGTLRCHFRQLAHDDPYVNVGLQDITAWVDFTRVGLAADSSGLDVLGFCTQAAFLLGTGIDSLADADSDPIGRARWASEARQLLLPGEMGEAFKVMALGRGIDAPLMGFGHQDLRYSL